jgi:hypothetical protein
MIMKIMKFFLPLLLLAVSCSNDNDKVVQTLDNEFAIVREVKDVTGLYIFDMPGNNNGLYTPYLVPAGALPAEFAKDGLSVAISGNITNNTITVTGYFMDGDGNETPLNDKYNTLELITMSETILLKGTKWKLAGIADSKTGTLKVLEPKDCEECFTLTFNTDYTAIVRSINAETLMLDLLNLNPDVNMDDSLWWELYDKDKQYYSDGNTFRRAILSTQFYTSTTKELKLYSRYTKESYLLFRPFKIIE